MGSRIVCVEMIVSNPINQIEHGLLILSSRTLTNFYAGAIRRSFFGRLHLIFDENSIMQKSADGHRT